MTRRFAALFVLIGAILGAGFALADGAFAHATVIGSDPAEGARLHRAPGVVTITFDESVGLGASGCTHAHVQGNPDL